MLLQQINDIRENFENFHKEHEELEVKAKAELKVLVKEVKSLRTTQSDLRQELSGIMKEKLEMEVKTLVAGDLSKSINSVKSSSKNWRIWKF